MKPATEYVVCIALVLILFILTGIYMLVNLEKTMDQWIEDCYEAGGVVTELGSDAYCTIGGVRYER